MPARTCNAQLPLEDEDDDEDEDEKAIARLLAPSSSKRAGARLRIAHQVAILGQI
jgi:hypothetical protein